MIPRLKQAGTVVIGTSSLSEFEIRKFAQPDFKLDKCNAESELETILRQISGGGR